MSAILQPSACVPQPRPPPPIGVLLKTKVKVQFDRAVDRAVEALFLSFLPVKSVSICWSFHTCNPLPMPRSAVGRNFPKAARRKPGAPDEPGFGLAGWNSAALPTVIVSDRRSREPNDLKPELRTLGQLPVANCLFSKIFLLSHPWALPQHRAFQAANQLRIQ